jgi:type VI secretion system protein ImpC
MPRPFSFGEANIDVDASGEPAPETPEPDTPFRILLLGDFSGRANRGISELDLAGRRPVLVDRDNFEEVLAKLQPELRLAPEISVAFRELDDFYPDRIFERLDLFSALREMRERLSDRSTFRDAWADLLPEPPAPPPAPASKVSLNDLLEATETRQAERPARAPDAFAAMVRDLVAPYLVPGADPRQAEMVAKVDAATAEVMRGLLHHADFQALEAAWRGLFFLVRRLETGVALKLYLLDISKAELAAELRRAPDLRSTGLYRILVEQTVETPGAEPWAVLGGHYTFDDSVDDVTLLGYLGGMARAAGAPFLAAASPSLLGAKSFGETPRPEQWRVEIDRAQAWEVLRTFPEARYLGLALPRFLLRLPYGKATEPLERFDFEETAGAPEHEHYLWGNPALACICLLGQAFAKSGWEMRPGAIRDIDGLPAHVYRRDGESHLKPCAEALLTEKAANAMLEKGLMPLLSLKDRDVIMLQRFQSLADPLAPLAGRWSSEQP